MSQMENVFSRAAAGGRQVLFEHEWYEVLEQCGINTPRHLYVPRGKKISRKSLDKIKSERVVLKIAGPGIIHKSDLGGVVFAQNNASALQKAMDMMIREVTDRLEQQKKPSEIAGVLLVEEVKHRAGELGLEIILGIRHSREFGPVVTIGLGGLDVDFYHRTMAEKLNQAIFSAAITDENDILHTIPRLALYEKLVLGYRGRGPYLNPYQLIDMIQKFIQLAKRFSALEKNHRFKIEEAEVNPFVVQENQLIPLDGYCRFTLAEADQERPTKRSAAIGPLLKPGSIAVMGVSQHMNMGRQILQNVLSHGFSRKKTYVVKPGLEELDGCLCVASIADLPETVDLFVLALPAQASAGAIAEITAAEKARSVILIAGGIGEKAGSRDIENSIRAILIQGRKAGKLTPVINGANCMGIISRHGKYNTTFLPAYKVQWQKVTGRQQPGVALISQSGAFLVSRLCQWGNIDPVYAVSLGNQIDLTISDYLEHLQDDPQISLFAIYLEGFAPQDGLRLQAIARDITKKGKPIFFFKGGQTEEGGKATTGHTASIAGDFTICRALLENAGVHVADTIQEFDQLVKHHVSLEHKKIGGNRVALMSNAGFECVVMADNLGGSAGLQLAKFSPKTSQDLTRLLLPLGVTALQDIKNPLDLMPMTDDAAFEKVAATILADNGVDCAVISPVPMSRELQTLPAGPGHQEDVTRPTSIAPRLVELFHKSSKPFVVSIDSGDLYLPMIQILQAGGVPTFRFCDEAVRFLGRYVHTRLKIKDIKGSI